MPFNNPNNPMFKDTDGTYRGLAEWIIKTLVFLISTFGVNQLKSISEEIQKLNMSLGDLKLELSTINNRITNLENDNK